MNYKEKLEVHYPIYVMERDFENFDTINRDLYKNILSLEKEFQAKNAAESQFITTEGGFQTPLDFNFLQQNNITVQNFLKKMIMPAVEDYLSKVFSEEANQLKPWAVGWANILRSNSWQRPHFHPTAKNVASGVYYLKIPDNNKDKEGHIEFINPIPISINHGYSNTRRIIPQEGKLIIFPPYYMHYVHPVSSNEDRVVIAFDILSEPPGIQFVF